MHAASHKSAYLIRSKEKVHPVRSQDKIQGVIRYGWVSYLKPRLSRGQKYIYRVTFIVLNSIPVVRKNWLRLCAICVDSKAKFRD